MQEISDKTESSDSAEVSSQTKRNYKRTIIVLLFIFLALWVFIDIIGKATSCGNAKAQDNALKNEPQYNKLVYCAQKLKNMVKDPESFEIYGSCGYYCNNSSLKDNVVYIVIPFRSTNTYGAYGTDTALFANLVYVGSISDYSRKTYQYWSKSDQISFLKAAGVFLEGIYEKKYTKEEIMKGLT